MESVLHIQPISREVERPLNIGHRDYISVGELSFKDEEEPLGEHAVQMLVGSPVDALDCGSQRTHIPLYKSFECMPDLGRPGKQVYLETIHYLKDQKYFIPVRTKIQSGTSQGMRLSNLPSINFIRQDISGDQVGVYDNRSTIISELLDRDGKLQSISHRPIIEWVKNDLIPYLDGSFITEVNFDVVNIERKIEALRSLLISTPSEINTYHLRDVKRLIDVESLTHPVQLYSKDVIAHSINDIERLCVPHGLDLKSHGKLNIGSICRLEYNPRSFQRICDIIDNVPLTDLNIDLISELDGSISFYHEHFAVHRLANLEDHDIGAWNSESLLEDLLNPTTLREIRKLFLLNHTQLSDLSHHVLSHYPVKIKIVKTIEDEAAIILYESNSSSKAEPLCGVYFDIALQSIAPVTISPSIIGF